MRKLAPLTSHSEINCLWVTLLAHAPPLKHMSPHDPHRLESGLSFSHFQPPLRPPPPQSGSSTLLRTPSPTHCLIRTQSFPYYSKVFFPGRMLSNQLKTIQGGGFQRLDVPGPPAGQFSRSSPPRGLTIFLLL